MDATMTGGRRSPFAAFSAPGFGLVWLSGLLWHLCRWGSAFLGTYYVNEATGSPRLVQLAGTVLYAPLLLGGVLGGVVSDRFDRLSTVRLQLAVLVPLTIGVGLLVRADRLPVWGIYAYLFVVGIGWVTDMTSRRALVFDVIGDDSLMDAAMSLESFSLSSGMALGALVGGYAVEAVGIGAAWFWIAGFLVSGFVLLAFVERPPARRRAAHGRAARDFTEGIAMLKRNRGLAGILGVTVIANFFLFAYFPIIPVIGEELGSGAFQVGLLLAGTGIGMMTGSILYARFQPDRRGVAYIGGVVVALGFLTAFALSTAYPLALATIIASGIGSGFFGSTQSTLVVTTVTEETRGRALGLLSMAIGALPVGMYVLGESAEVFGARTALAVNAVLGAVVLAWWLRRRPEVIAMAASAPNSVPTSTTATS